MRKAIHINSGLPPQTSPIFDGSSVNPNYVVLFRSGYSVIVMMFNKLKWLCDLLLLHYPELYSYLILGPDQDLLIDIHTRGYLVAFRFGLILLNANGPVLS